MPADVTDPLLWRLANAVAAAHQPAADGCCTNLQCRTTTAPYRPVPFPRVRDQPGVA